MTASTSTLLSSTQMQDAQNKANTLAGAGTKVVSDGQFVFFAAFDGTNNTKENPSYSGDPQSTSVGQIFTQYEQLHGEGASGRYYPGPGTPGTLMHSSFNPAMVTEQINATANKAYEDFREQALNWLAADPNRTPADITAIATGFSRGGPTAVVFTQLLAERGLTGADGAVLIPPLDARTGLGGVPVAGLMGVDNVSTGYLGDLRIPQNVNANNIVMIVAENEFRRLFPSDDYSADPRAQTYGVVGNHGDAGGSYDNGLGALSLQAQTEVLRNFGLTLADVPADRQYDPDKPIVIHNESVDSYGNQVWDEYGSSGSRLARTIAGPVLSGVFGDTVLGVTAVANGDETMTQRIAYKNGEEVFRVLDAAGNPLLTVMPGETLVRDPQSGSYTVYNLAKQETSTYNPGTQAYTLNNSSGVEIAGNSGTGEYQMRIPRADGDGYTEYTRKASEAGGWTVAQVDIDSAGQTRYEFTGLQSELDGAVLALSENWQSDANHDGVLDQATTRNWLSADIIETTITSQDPGSRDLSTLTMDKVSYDLLDFSQRSSAESRLNNLYQLGGLDAAQWSDFSRETAYYLVNGGLGLLPDGGLGLQPGGGLGLQLDPIGAFYESKVAATDNAASIAGNTLRILSSTGAAVTATQLTALDANQDGKLSDTELDTLTAWRDFNEDGIGQSAELTTLATALADAEMSSVRSSDYGFYTTGNARYRSLAQSSAAAPGNWRIPPTMPLAPPSNYRTLRDTDKIYYINSSQWIYWEPHQVKINNGNRSYLIGTDGNDAFDANYYAAYSAYFNNSLLVNFLAGGGDDLMGGSIRNDMLWGGTGNDTLMGYAGDDRVYGEEGNDELQGNDGNDVLDGGIGNDILFGQNGNDILAGAAGDDELQGESGSDTLDGGLGADKLFGGVGNDVLHGGDGDDVILGFTPINDIKQTLAFFETDNDVMSGGAGADEMWGGLGNDTIDGGADNDLVMGDDGADTLFGDAGDDEVNGGMGHDILDGGAGADKLFGGVGNDRMWGGDGNDILQGFTPSNDTRQTLAIGETDDDLMYGGAGDDFMLGGLGADQMWGGFGHDELQGADGDDALYGEDGDDRLFGGAGDDTIYGGNGDDIIVGGAAANEAALNAGVSDSNFLYGGAGNDTVIGGVGKDTIDGGAGADNMEGGKGDDIYVVNSVNDVILEHAGEGDDTVHSSANYILNANIEALRLVEGFNIHGTGNSLDNRITGNSADNILDGVTGADAMAGGLGNDTYYVDNGDDTVVELADEGTDTVNASVSHALGASVENLTLLDFSKAEKGLADGVDILVYGYPKANELDYMQGNAVAGYVGTCALTSIANLATQANQALSEAQVVQTAIDNGWCTTSDTATDYQRGGSNYLQQQALLNSYDISNGIILGYHEQAIANLIKGGRGVIIGLNAGTLWDDSNYLDNGGVNHVVTVTGVACDAQTGELNGFYIADSGRGLVSDMTRYVSIADFRNHANVASAYTIYTTDPIKLRDENIDATGNELANVITGNRGDNLLAGGLSNDILVGQAGNDTYVFNMGDGQDTIQDTDSTVGNTDVLQLSGIKQTNLWFSQMGVDLQIDVLGTNDRLTLKDWYVGGVTGTDNRVERIRTADGLTMHDTDVERFVQAMAAFAPPPATQTDWRNGQTSNGQVLLTVTH